jgi:hypothetical protein
MAFSFLAVRPQKGPPAFWSEHLEPRSLSSGGIALGMFSKTMVTSFPPSTSERLT